MSKATYQRRLLRAFASAALFTLGIVLLLSGTYPPAAMGGIVGGVICIIVVWTLFMIDVLACRKYLDECTRLPKRMRPF